MAISHERFQVTESTSTGMFSYMLPLKVFHYECKGFGQSLI